MSQPTNEVGGLLMLNARIAIAFFDYQWWNDGQRSCLARGGKAPPGFPIKGKRGGLHQRWSALIPDYLQDRSLDLIDRMAELGYYPVIYGPRKGYQGTVGGWTAGFLPVDEPPEGRAWSERRIHGPTLGIALARAALFTQGVRFIIVEDSRPAEPHTA